MAARLVGCVSHPVADVVAPDNRTRWLSIDMTSSARLDACFPSGSHAAIPARSRGMIFMTAENKNVDGMKQAGQCGCNAKLCKVCCCYSFPMASRYRHGFLEQVLLYSRRLRKRPHDIHMLRLNRASRSKSCFRLDQATAM